MRMASLALTAATLCFGAGAVLSKIALDYFSPFTLLSVQLCASVVVLWLVSYKQMRVLSVGKHWLPLMGIGIINPGLGFLFALLALNYTSASMASLIWATQPILILVLAWFVLGERPNMKLLLCCCLAIAGAVVIAVSAASSGNATLLGNALALLSAFCVACYVVLMRRVALSLPPMVITAVLQTAALGFSLAVLPIGLSFLPQPAIEIPTGIFFIAISSGVIYYGLAFWLYNSGIRRLSAGIAGLFLNLTPVFTIVLAFLILSERLTIAQWAGSVLVLASVIGMSLVSLPPKEAVVEQRESN